MSERLDNLKAQRALAGYTITELAQRAVVSVFLIAQLEGGGACDVDEAQRLADALSVSLATLGKADL